MNVLWKWPYKIKLTTWSCKCELCALWTHCTILRGPNPPLFGICNLIWLLLGTIICMHIIVWLWSHSIQPIWCSPSWTPLVTWLLLPSLYISLCANLEPIVSSTLQPLGSIVWGTLWEVVIGTSCGTLSFHGFVVDLQRTLWKTKVNMYPQIRN